MRIMLKIISLKGKCLTLAYLVPFFVLAQDIQLGLQAHYDFNGSTIIDQSSNAINGSALDLSATNGVEDTLNSAFFFNGNSSRITFNSDNRNITNSVTLSAWFKTESTERQFIFSKYNAAQDRGYFLATINGTVSLGGRDGSSQFYEIFDSELLINDGEWHHVVGIVDKNNWKLYVDCQEVASNTTMTDSPSFENTDPLTAGYWHEGAINGTARHFEGIIDEIRLYNRAITGEDVEELCLQENYIATWNTAYGLKAYFDFNQEGLIKDLSETSIDGTALNLAIGSGIEDTTGSAYVFNGASSGITCTSDHRGITDRVSLSAWIRTESSARQFIFAKYNSAQDAGYFLATLNGTATIGGRDGSSTFHEVFDPNILINDGEWHHVAGIIDQNKWQLYIDCVLVASMETNTTSPGFQNTDLLTIGFWNEGTAEGNKRYFDGTIDELRLYNIAIRPELVSILCNRETLVSTTDQPEVTPNDVQVFPNPADSYIRWTIEGIGPYHPRCYSIVDLFGRLVDKGKLQTDEIKIGNLPSGTYFLILEDQKHKRYTTKFIKY